MPSNQIIPAPKVFETFSIKGRKFIALPRGSAEHIIDDEGHNYGSWSDREKFKKNYREVAAMQQGYADLGKARLMIIPA